MCSLILFLAMGFQTTIEYDHGYYTSGRSDSKDIPIVWVPLVNRFELVGIYKGNFFNGEYKGYLIFQRIGTTDIEIVSPDSFSKHGKLIELKSRKNPLIVFDDSDLSVEIKRGK